MSTPTRLAAVTSVAALFACGGPPRADVVPTPPAHAASAAPRPADSGVAAPGPSATPSSTATPSAAVPVPAVRAVPMYAVVRIYSLFEVVETGGTVEMRIGTDPGGGASGWFRYAPIVRGLPDLEQETDARFHADTTAGFIELAGRRPDLLFHEVSGFRSGQSDRYETLDAFNRWRGFKDGSASGLGWGIFAWSNDRLLEWRGDDRFAESRQEGMLPRLRVVHGKDRQAPELSAALARRLTDAGFLTETVRAFRTGEVVAVGDLLRGTGFGTVVWRDKLREPAYFEHTEPFTGGSDLRILGGSSLADVRLLAGDQVMRLEGAAWVPESTVTPDLPPDVWFGAPMVERTDKGWWARVEAGAPWQPLGLTSKGDPRDERSYAVDGDGVIWGNEGDLLVSSRQPNERMNDVSEADLVKARKASILRGGSNDVTGQPPQAFGTQTCSMHYVLLDEAPAATADTKDYPRLRAALAGHPELAGMRFIVSLEKGQQFFGALVASYDKASELEKLVRKGVRGSAPNVLCAEPPAVREIKVDLATGKVLP
ncbi:MAG: hypothetical protein IT373_18900 [Polyangiaceae bacterium]|nr:hypothetical protein [Polyangiaceae bacterium]